MTVTLGVKAIVALVGALTHALAANPKLQQLGLVAFGAGLLAALLGLR